MRFAARFCNITTVSSASSSPWSARTVGGRSCGLLLLAAICMAAAPTWGQATSGPPAAPLRPHPKAIANTHPPDEVDNPALVPFVVKRGSVLPGVVVDEMDAKLVGQWQYSTHTPPYVGIGYLHDQKSGKGAKSVTYTPTLRAGWYEVRMSHCYNIRRSTNTPVTIHHADGEQTVRINQQQTPPHAKLFRTLGIFRFKAGRHGWVRISNEGTDGKHVIADAVQFLPAKPPQEPLQKAPTKVLRD